MSHHYLRFLIVPSLMLLSGCTIGGMTVGTPSLLGGSDFSSMYESRIKNSIADLRDIA
jgi:hypothetical protein